MAGTINVRYQQYLNSDSWKCEPSPTGAHHWVEMIETVKLSRGGYFRCKHCQDVRRFPTTWGQVQPTNDAGRVMPNPGRTVDVGNLGKIKN